MQLQDDDVKITVVLQASWCVDDVAQVREVEGVGVDSS